MKYSIGNKLFASGLVVMVCIILMIIASQVVGGLFKDTSKKLVIEYNELDAVQEFKFSYSQLLMAPSSYSIYGNNADEQYFKILIHKAEHDLQLCEKVLTNSHDLRLLQDFKRNIYLIDSLGTKIFRLNYLSDSKDVNSLLNTISKTVDKGLIKVDLLLSETKEEIDEYIDINNTIIRHSTITILSLGLLIALIILSGGWIFIRSLTHPIKELVSTTNKISQGDRLAKVSINTKDEFHTLAESFNRMVDNLEETTVSKDYFDSILTNMFDALIVTDKQLKIRSVNQAACDLLKFKEQDLIDKDIAILFGEKSVIDPLSNIKKLDLRKEIFEINNRDYLVTETGERISTLLSCAALKNQNEEINGLVIVGHDLTEKKIIEQKLEQSRKERLIDINEAQEEERIRIATDLHDGLGQMLTAISYSVEEMSSDELNTAYLNRKEATIKIQDQIDRAIKEAKTLAHNLIPIVLKDFGLIVAIENLISKANELYQTKFRFDSFDFDERIDPKREKALYRICQESLNNTVKHAKAKNASYQIFWQDCSVVLVIEDDGIGFDLNKLNSESKKHGIGLVSMRERSLAFDGNFTLNTQPGQGTEIIVEIPCRINT